MLFLVRNSRFCYIYDDMVWWCTFLVFLQIFFHTGGGVNARDRWFDKSVHHIFFKNGLCACNCDVSINICKWGILHVHVCLKYIFLITYSSYLVALPCSVPLWTKNMQPQHIYTWRMGKEKLVIISCISPIYLSFWQTYMILQKVNWDTIIWMNSLDVLQSSLHYLSNHSSIHPSIHLFRQPATYRSHCLHFFQSLEITDTHMYGNDWICDKSPWNFKSKYLHFKLYWTEFISSMLHLMVWWLFQLFIILTFKFRGQKANGRYVNFRFFSQKLYVLNAFVPSTIDWNVNLIVYMFYQLKFKLIMRERERERERENRQF